MANPLAAKMGRFTDFTPDERALLDRAIAAPVRRPAGTDLIAEGDRPDDVIVMLDGWACRYKMLADGGRQIVAYLIAGDLCDPHVFILDQMDHSIGLLTDATLAFIPKAVILDLIDACPPLARGLWWSALVDEAVLRHWLVNMGRRDAYDRLAHLFCELWDRMEIVGLREGDEMELPLTQEQIGDTLGLTAVHTNRVIQRMRGEGLITLARRKLRIHDIARLRAAAEYDPTYLHLSRRRANPTGQEAAGNGLGRGA